MLIQRNKSAIARIVIILVLIAAAYGSAQAATLPVLDNYPAMQMVEVISQVGASANDAEESTNSGNVNLTSPDLQLGADNNTAQLVGLRFTNIAIPRNAIIISAYVEFEVAATGSTSTSVTIQGQAIDNAPAFTSAKNNISARSRTTAQVVWNNIPAWSALNAKWQTPDLSAIVQQIVNRSNWANGNSIAIIISGSGERTAESYDGEPPAAPRLIINYAIPTPTFTPTATNNGLTPTVTPTPTNIFTPQPPGAIRFGVIGDYGKAGQPELDVANLVKSWNPDFIITTGDNNYSDGASSTIDANIGQYYHEFIYPYNGSYGSGAATNRFFPSLGNHDWHAVNAQPYLDYFTLPNNERYYDFVQGPVHFFVIDSDGAEPDGTSSSSVQGLWLQNGLAASTSPWNLVYMHHPPYSSGSNHGSTPTMQWPYAAWGADAILTGHDHTYERLFRDGIPYFVNGLGGHSSLYSFGSPIPESQVRYNNDYGAMLVEANEWQITFQFITRTGVVIDTYTLNKPATPTPAFTSTSTVTATATQTPTYTATFTSTATDTPTATATTTPTATHTLTNTPTPTRTATATQTPTFTSTATSTPSSTPTLPPFPIVISIVCANTNPANATSVDFIVAFSESVTGVDVADFALTTTGVTGASITNVSGSDATYTVTVNTGFGNGTIRLDVVDDDNIVDADNNPLGGDGLGNGNFTSGETYSINKEKILNGGFNTYTGTSKIPTNWKAVNFSTSDGKNTTYKKEGMASVRIIGTVVTKTLSQTLNISGLSGDAFNFSFWVKGSAIPTVGICRAQILFYNGATLNPIRKTVNCGNGTYAFKQKPLSFTAPGDYTKIVVRFTYSKASGRVWFDNVSLMR